MSSKLGNIVSEMIDFGLRNSPLVSRGMYSHHIATLMNGNIPLVKNCYNHITGKCLNCHAEQHAILSYLRQTPQLRHLTKTFNFTSPINNKMMYHFKTYSTTKGNIT